MKCRLFDDCVEWAGDHHFWSWFDANWSNFDKDIAKNDYYIFVPSDLDFQNSNLLPQLLLSSVIFPLN